MQFLPTELVHKIDHETHKVRLADVMFQNQRRYWQIQHQMLLNPEINDPEQNSYWRNGQEFEEVIETAFGDFWGEEITTDFGLKCGEWYWGRASSSAEVWVGEKLDKGDKRGYWMWEEYDEYILQEPHPEIIKVDCGLCCGCKWGTKCLR